jgi:hypothetical protein
MYMVMIMILLFDYKDKLYANIHVYEQNKKQYNIKDA